MAMKWFFRWRTKEYSISTGTDDWVAPEETLVDSTSVHSDLEMPISEGIFRFTSAIFGICFLVVAGTVFYFTVVRGQNFADAAIRNKTVNFSVAPPRGAILDRNGKTLVQNVPSFDILVVVRDLPKDSKMRASEIAKVAGILDQSVDEFSIMIREQSKKGAVFFVATNLPKEKVLAIKNINPRGFYLLTGTRRSYVDGHQFSHVLGYVGKVTKEDLLNDPYYLPSDSVGRIGIESAYEESLRGTHGKITFTKKDEQGASQDPVIGNSVVLNIDADLQKKLYSDMFEVLRSANLGGASAVVQDPRTGAVLALVSFPSYDNNIFSDTVSQDEFRQLFESKLRPLFNRAIGGLFNPGSTIKPFIGMAALFEKIVTPATTIQDCLSITIPNPANPSDPYVFSNWRPDTGLFNLRRAIAQSCNVYFYTVGGGFGDILGLGIQKIAKYLSAAFANKKLGIDIGGEEAGFVPTPEWKERTRGEPWYQGDTYNTSIGQGDLLVTPLWLNTYVSAVANGGTIWRPQVAQKIITTDGQELQVFEPQKLGKLPFDQASIDEVHSDMRETVLTGTAKLLQDVPVAVSAKTGTAEVIKGRRINALFTAFAPSDNPTLSITILVEGSASNEGYAIRVANTVLKWWFDPNRAH